jgi:hypothetical protein
LGPCDSGLSAAPGETLVRYDGISQQASWKRNCGQYGGGSLKAIIYSAILIIAVFVAYKVLPAYVAEYQLSDKMQEQARFAIVNH